MSSVKCMRLLHVVRAPCEVASHRYASRWVARFGGKEKPAAVRMHRPKSVHRAAAMADGDESFREEPFELGYVTDVEGNLDYFRRRQNTHPPERVCVYLCVRVRSSARVHVMSVEVRHDMYKPALPRLSDHRRLVRCELCEERPQDPAFIAKLILAVQTTLRTSHRRLCQPTSAVWFALRRYVELSRVLTYTKDDDGAEVLDLLPGKHFVYGGDVFDKVRCAIRRHVVRSHEHQNEPAAVAANADH
eukprot:1196057-Prorocentrum_minimum.AAC.3